MASPAALRGFAGALIDRFASWYYELPAEICTYTIQETRVPLGDGVDLVADIYQPLNSPLGTLLVFSPYGRGLSLTITTARVFASRGYQVLFVSTRGTFGSSGTFDPGRTEVEDTQGVLKWMRKQPWYTGSFATLGASYLGYCQWALLEDQPDDMAAAVVIVRPHDFSRLFWETGAFSLSLIEWADLVSYQEEEGFFASSRRIATAKTRLQPILGAIPLADAADDLFADRAPWLRDRIARGDLSDPFWKPMQHQAVLERVTIPIFLISGWQDVFLAQTMEQYSVLSKRGSNVALTVGPWTHLDVNGGGTVKQSLDWLDEHLARREEQTRAMPVRVYVTGAEEWRDIPTWPPATISRTLYVDGSNKLSPDKPIGDDSTYRFDFNPREPTPTMGGPILFGGGKVNDTALSRRSDVLIFTSSPLEEDVDVFGKPCVNLTHTSDNPHVDLFVRLSEVNAKGVSHNITETYRRLEPNRESKIVQLSLLDCAHRFRKGTSVQLLIAGGCHPQFYQNLGTGENPGTGSTTRPATHTIHFGGSAVSNLVLPVGESASE
ncbi:X-Pro dipeptidyl-peptidase-domain-containing protein [Ilyonectria sp. MPI-CAGE-AT-0026]|nr:X-Pro dipeptidyl-peptidase-domain-containing protein [Ilyonectria sp. MPI-CAGE-AT-0026]